MTISTALLVIVGGTLALVVPAVNLVTRGAVTKRETNPALKVLLTETSKRLFQSVSGYVQMFFGVLSLTQPTALASTTLGTSVCAGIAIYFALLGGAYARAPELRIGGAYDVNITPVTYLAFTTAGCYAAAVLARYVI
jgi:hypothetical protein